MAGLCKSQLGFCHVHLPLVSGDACFESEEQYGLYVCALSLVTVIQCRFCADLWQLRGLGPLELVPELLNTQQIDWRGVVSSGV